MLAVAGTTWVFVATTSVDLRGSFNRLYSLVVDHLKGDPLSGNLLLFSNHRRIGYRSICLFACQNNGRI